jgi:hypothetical protein
MVAADLLLAWLYIHVIYIYIYYTWYIHGILHVYAVLNDMSGIYLVNTSLVCSVPFFNNDIPLL